MNLGQLRTALQARGYGTDTATTQTECINAAYRKVCGDHHWEWLEATDAENVAVAATSVTFSVTDVLTTQGLRAVFPATGNATDQYNPAYLPPQEFRNRQYGEWQLDLVGNRTLGAPEYWTHRTSASGLAFVQFSPSADRAYRLDLDYIRDPADLSADGDTPIFPATYHDILVDGALAEMGARHRDWAMHDRYKAEFNHGLSRMRAQLGIEQQQTSLQVRKSGFFDAPERWPER